MFHDLNFWFSLKIKRNEGGLQRPSVEARSAEFFPPNLMEIIATVAYSVSLMTALLYDIHIAGPFLYPRKECLVISMIWYRKNLAHKELLDDVSFFRILFTATTT